MFADTFNRHTSHTHFTHIHTRPHLLLLKIDPDAYAGPILSFEVYCDMVYVHTHTHARTHAHTRTHTHTHTFKRAHIADAIAKAITAKDRTITPSSMEIFIADPVLAFVFVRPNDQCMLLIYAVFLHLFLIPVIE